MLRNCEAPQNTKSLQDLRKTVGVVRICARAAYAGLKDGLLAQFCVSPDLYQH